MAKVKFYTPEELNELQPFFNGEKMTEQKLEDFCKRTGRTYNSVSVYVYTKRMRARNANKETVKKVVKTPKTPKAELAPTVKDQSVVNIGKGEFNIPIKSWTITQHTDGFYFNVKF
jgi:hypothetical protein